MALIKCPECGKEISDKSSVCIHCGFPLKSQLEKECSENICVVNGIPFNFTEIIEDVNNFYKKFFQHIYYRKIKLRINIKQEDKTTNWN